MTRAKKSVRSDDGEAHRVLTAFPDALSFLGFGRKAIGPRVGGDEQRAVCRVDSQAVDVNRARIGRRQQIRDCASGALIVAAGENCQRDDDGGSAQREESDQEPAAFRCRARLGLLDSARCVPLLLRHLVVMMRVHHGVSLAPSNEVAVDGVGGHAREQEGKRQARPEQDFVQSGLHRARDH